MTCHFLGRCHPRKGSNAGVQKFGQPAPETTYDILSYYDGLSWTCTRYASSPRAPREHTAGRKLEALNRHRGKGQQKVTVEHVHVHEGGQAIVGNVESRGEGSQQNQRINPMQSELPMHLSRRCGARTRRGSRCRSPAMPNGRCRLHGGMSPGAPKGNRNAYKHGRYTAQAIEGRREITALLRAARSLTKCGE